MTNDRDAEERKDRRSPGSLLAADKHWSSQWRRAFVTERGARDPERADGGYTRDDLTRSLLGCGAGIAAMPVIGICVSLLVMAGAAHWTAYFTIGAIIPGMVISLVDRRWGLITAPVVLGLVVMVLLVMLGGPEDPTLCVCAIGFLLSILLGAGLGQVLQYSRAGRVVGVVALASLLLAPFVAAEVELRADSQRFLRGRYDEVREVITNEIIRLPDAGVDWHHVLIRRSRCIGVTAEWHASPSPAGSGDCRLETRWWPGLYKPASDCLRRVSFRYEPDGPASVKTEDEARGLLRGLGLCRLPEKLGKGTLRGGGACWGGTEGDRHFTITEGGDVRVESTPFSDWD